jgi:hypothetical protein
MNKRRARKAHLIRRARERFGLELTNEDLIAIKRQITAQSAVCLREGTTSEVWLVHYQGVYMRAAYDPLRNQMTTFMTWEGQT